MRSVLLFGLVLFLVMSVSAQENNTLPPASTGQTTSLDKLLEGLDQNHQDTVALRQYVVQSYQGIAVGLNQFYTDLVIIIVVVDVGVVAFYVLINRFYGWLMWKRWRQSRERYSRIILNDLAVLKARVEAVGSDAVKARAAVEELNVLIRSLRGEVAEVKLEKRKVLEERAAFEEKKKRGGIRGFFGRMFNANYGKAEVVVPKPEEKVAEVKKDV